MQQDDPWNELAAVVNAGAQTAAAALHYALYTPAAILERHCRNTGYNKTGNMIANAPHHFLKLSAHSLVSYGLEQVSDRFASSVLPIAKQLSPEDHTKEACVLIQDIYFVKKDKTRSRCAKMLVDKIARQHTSLEAITNHLQTHNQELLPVMAKLFHPSSPLIARIQTQQEMLRLEQIDLPVTPQVLSPYATRHDELKHRTTVQYARLKHALDRTGLFNTENNHDI